MEESSDFPKIDPDENHQQSPPSSPVDIVLAEIAEHPVVHRMDWSLGMAGDILWMLLPESRKFLFDMIRDEVSSADEQDRQIYSPSVTTILLESFWYPLLKPALENYPLARDRVVYYCSLILLMWNFEDPDRDYTREGIEEAILDNIRDTSYEEIIEKLIPNLHQLVIGCAE